MNDRLAADLETVEGEYDALKLAWEPTKTAKDEYDATETRLRE